MSPKYRFLLAVLLTLFAICSQVVFGQTKEVQKKITIGNAKLGIELKSLQPLDCSAGSGAINISVTGGSGKYTFKWTGPSGFISTNQNISAPNIGNYTVEIRDDTNCTVSKTWAVNSVCVSPCTLGVVGLVTNASACNLANGKVMITVSGGSGSYQYKWYNALFNLVSVTKDLLTSLPGVYYVEVTDLINPTCSSFSIFTIESAFKVTSTSTANNSCSLPFTGTATALATGGSGNYSYEWLFADAVTKRSGANLTAASGGSYTLTVKDNTLNCTISQSVYISNSALAKLNVLGSVSPSTMCSPGNGGVDITVSNGSGNYNYSWYNQTTYAFAAATEDLQTATPANYSVYVTDNISKCSVYEQFTVVDQTVKPNFALAKTDNENCAAPFNGSIALEPAGSVGPFSIVWYTGSEVVSTSLTPSALSPGAYGFTLTDTKTGCAVSRDYAAEPIVIEDHSITPLSINVDDVIQNSSCATPNGAIQVSIVGQNYSVYWSGENGFSASTEDLMQLDSGQYTLTVSAVCNAAPIIIAQQLVTQPDEAIRLNLMDIISDPDNNLDPSSFEIVQLPTSGASAQIEQNSDLVIRYTNQSFRGADQLTIKACDLLQACSENVITINIEDIIVHNAVAPNSNGENKYMRIFNLPKGNRVSIFNRWGDLIFKIDEYDNQTPGKRFEGLNLDGKGLPSGTYFYKIEFQSGLKPLTGYLALKQS